MEEKVTIIVQVKIVFVSKSKVILKPGQLDRDEKHACLMLIHSCDQKVLVSFVAV
jgi:hypothetical protein